MFINSLVVAFYGDSSTAETISALILQSGAVISYILAEGWVDAAYIEG